MTCYIFAEKIDKKQMKEKKEEMTFLGHLEELRWHLVRAAIAVLVLATAAFLFSDFIFGKVILEPRTPEFFTNKAFARLAEITGISALNINSQPLQIINIKMAGQFLTHIKISAIAGMIFAFPYIIYEGWRFIKPALHTNETKHTKGGVFYTSILFFIGVIFAYYLIVPLSINFLGGYTVNESVTNQINLGSYIQTVSSIMLAGGITFELPIVIYFLSKIGLVTPETLRKYWKHAIIGMLALSAIITPPDVFSQVMVCVPLIFLYAVGIRISKRVVKASEKEK
jgi:sec-independent protein translocase protein TatC